MEKQKKVVDASVVVKWFLNEAGSENALKLKEEHVLGKTLIVVPELMVFEVLNALRFKKKTQTELVEAGKFLEDMQFRVEKTSEFILQKTIQVSLQYNLTIYDAAYIALAMVHGAPMITADKELAVVPNVVLLGSI